MGEEKADAIDGRIETLRAELADLEAKRADPKRQKIRGLYAELDRVLNSLEELGEDVVTTDGDAVTVLGTQFSYMYGLDLRER